MLYVLGTISMGFVGLTILVLIFPHSFIDLKFSQELQEHQNPFLDGLMKFISWFGYSPGSTITVAAGILLFLVSGYRKEALFVFFTSFSGLISTGIKVIIDRPRPSEPLVRVVRKATEYSFPSGHVLFYVIYFGFLSVLMYSLRSIPKWIRLTVGTFSLFMVFTIPFSRIYLGAHWFTDVTAGFLLGMLCLYALCFFYFKKPAETK